MEGHVAVKHRGATGCAARELERALDRFGA